MFKRKYDYCGDVLCSSQFSAYGNMEYARKDNKDAYGAKCGFHVLMWYTLTEFSGGQIMLSIVAAYV